LTVDVGQRQINWSEHVLMKVGAKPLRTILDLALRLSIARLTNTDENMTLFKQVLVIGGVGTTVICPLSVVG